MRRHTSTAIALIAADSIPMLAAAALIPLAGSGDPWKRLHLTD
jgi:hypothetical protein